MALQPSALIDFTDPYASASDVRPRLRKAFGKPRQVLQAQTLSEVRPLLAWFAMGILAQPARL